MNVKSLRFSKILITSWKSKNISYYEALSILKPKFSNDTESVPSISKQVLTEKLSILTPQKHQLVNNFTQYSYYDIKEHSTISTATQTNLYMETKNKESSENAR